MKWTALIAEESFLQVADLMMETFFNAEKVTASDSNICSTFGLDFFEYSKDIVQNVSEKN